MTEVPARLTDILSTPPPSAYRLILLAKNGTVSASVPVAVEDDAQGRDRARSMVNGNAVELWDGLRFIEHFPSVG